METTVNVRKQPKYWAISIAAIMATAFVLVQPAMQASNAELSSEGLPVGGYDDCVLREGFPDDPISQNSVRNGHIVKTIHAEKEIYKCFLVQGNIPVIVDLTTFIEVYENITAREVIETNFISVTCLKDEPTAALIDCESDEDIPKDIVPVGSSCTEIDINFPQEMNTVNKGKIAKTIETQKEQFLCDFTTSPVIKKVDIVLFTEIYEDLNTQQTLEVQFHVARCVIVVFDGVAASADGSNRDARLEGCTFDSRSN